jgi:glycosyltransferase involved in cell wall biosynthesis
MVSRIAIIIPTFNEEKNIERLIKNIKHYVGNALIIVVDDSNNNKISTIIKKKN